MDCYKSRFRIKKFYITTLKMTSNFQGIVMAFAFILLLGNSGILTTLGERWSLAGLNDYDLYTTSGILITFIYSLYCIFSKQREFLFIFFLAFSVDYFFLFGVELQSLF